MKIDLDKFGLWYFLESCLRGSHLRSSHVQDFTDVYFDKLTPSERKFLYDCVLDKLHDGEFKPDSCMCGHDTWFMARYNPDNQYSVKVKGCDKEVLAFKLPNDDTYYIGEHAHINESYIISVTKIEPPTEE